MSEENKKMRQHRMSRAEREQTITRLTREMKEAARLLQFEHAAFLRDEIEKLQRGEDPTADTSTRRAAEKQRKTGKGRRSYKKVSNIQIDANNRITIKGAREHNLKNVNLVLPRNKLIVMTGLSGSGKSSLAFDTIFADGQRRYMESLSSYARMFLGQMAKARCGRNHRPFPGGFH